MNPDDKREVGEGDEEEETEGDLPPTYSIAEGLHELPRKLVKVFFQQMINFDTQFSDFIELNTCMHVYSIISCMEIAFSRVAKFKITCFLDIF